MGHGPSRDGVQGAPVCLKMAHHQVQAPKLKPFPTSVPGLAPDQLQAVAAALERINVAKDARDRAEAADLVLPQPPDLRAAASAADGRRVIQTPLSIFH